MTFIAIKLIRTPSLFNTLYIFIFLPLLALNWLVVFVFWVPAKILNIMGINTLETIMINSNWAPDSFIHVEIKL